MKHSPHPFVHILLVLTLFSEYIHAKNEDKTAIRQHYTMGQCKFNIDLVKNDASSSRIYGNPPFYYVSYNYPLSSSLTDSFGIYERNSVGFDLYCATGYSQDKINSLSGSYRHNGVWVTGKNHTPVSAYLEQELQGFEIAGTNWNGVLTVMNTPSDPEDMGGKPDPTPPIKDFVLCINQNNGHQAICGSGYIYYDVKIEIDAVLEAIKAISFDSTFTPVSPSFDCAKQSSLGEQFVCADSMLSKYDAVLDQNYKQIKASLKADRQKTLALGQRAWLRQRDKCKDLDCFIQSYTRRIDELCTTYANVPSCKRAAAIQLP
ncbi:MAG: lysozyme inhibitor LprI family protein [Azoarcus sp.]|jgi:uncharacterized protein YecT (DUF1311 family)|nr:lysozyme inhibitor LprI family protein [Azoarcus sp.]